LFGKNFLYNIKILDMCLGEYLKINFLYKIKCFICIYVGTSTNKTPPSVLAGKHTPIQIYKLTLNLKPMKTLAQFKQELNITSIDLLKGKGRMYAQVRDKQLVVSSKCDLSLPLFVTELSEAVDKDKPLSPENSRVIPNVYLLINAENLTVAGSI